MAWSCPWCWPLWASGLVDEAFEVRGAPIQTLVRLPFAKGPTAASQTAKATNATGDEMLGVPSPTGQSITAVRNPNVRILLVSTGLSRLAGRLSNRDAHAHLGSAVVRLTELLLDAPLQEFLPGSPTNASSEFPALSGRLCYRSLDCREECRALGQVGGNLFCRPWSIANHFIESVWS